MYKSSNVVLENTVTCNQQQCSMLSHPNNTMYFFNFDYKQMPNNLSNYSKATNSHLLTFINIFRTPTMKTQDRVWS